MERESGFARRQHLIAPLWATIYHWFRYTLRPRKKEGPDHYQAEKKMRVKTLAQHRFSTFSTFMSREREREKGGEKSRGKLQTEGKTCSARNDLWSRTNFSSWQQTKRRVEIKRKKKWCVVFDATLQVTKWGRDGEKDKLEGGESCSLAD